MSGRDIPQFDLFEEIRKATWRYRASQIDYGFLKKRPESMKCRECGWDTLMHISRMCPGCRQREKDEARMDMNREEE